MRLQKGEEEGEEGVLDLSTVQLASGARVRLLLPQDAGWVSDERHQQ